MSKTLEEIAKDMAIALPITYRHALTLLEQIDSKKYNFSDTPCLFCQKDFFIGYTVNKDGAMIGQGWAIKCPNCGRNIENE